MNEKLSCQSEWYDHTDKIPDLIRFIETDASSQWSLSNQYESICVLTYKV
ncbi:hypothetical protein [Aliikangiella coralliicola]|nr:hypothetical protein [Aliikangiella coralliicola]